MNCIHTMRSDLTTAAIKREFDKLQSAESNGSAPQKSEAIGLYEAMLKI